MRTLQKIALVLVIIGALNWGLIGLFKFDLVAAIFGGQTAFLSRLVYGLVGLSGLISISLLFLPNEEADYDRNHQRITNTKFATEFGEENDLSDVRKRDNE